MMTTASPRRLARASWLPPALWAIFAVLLLGIGLLLLRDCALGLPLIHAGWLIDFCPIPAAAGPDTALSAGRARQAMLQAELVDLQRKATLRRQSCQLRPSEPETRPETTPEPAPEPTPELEPTFQTTPEPEPIPESRLPEKPIIPQKINPDRPFDYLKGCWITGRNLFGKEDTEKKFPFVDKICVDDRGAGQIISEFADGRTCRGPVRVTQDDERNLTFDVGKSSCPRGPLSALSASRIFCIRQSDGAAKCVIKQKSAADIGVELRRERPDSP